MTSEPKWGWMQDGAENTHGPFDTRDAALADARREMEDQGTVVLGHCRFADPGTYVPTLAEIGERLDQSAYDNEFGFSDDTVFDEACPFTGIHDHKACVKQAEDELAAWARRWFSSDAWTLDEVETIVLDGDRPQEKPERCLCDPMIHAQVGCPARDCPFTNDHARLAVEVARSLACILHMADTHDVPADEMTRAHESIKLAFRGGRR